MVRKYTVTLPIIIYSDPITNNDDYCNADTCEYVPGHYCVNEETSTYCLPVCGNFFKTSQEQCIWFLFFFRKLNWIKGDDGNTIDGDGCSSNCTLESGYSCDFTDGMEISLKFKE